MRDAGCAMRHLGSDDVWSCRICHRFPRFWRRSVNGPLAVTESPRRSAKRAVQSARSSVRGRTRTSSNVSESRSLPGAKDRKSTRLNSSHDQISYAVFCLKKKKKKKKEGK